VCCLFYWTCFVKYFLIVQCSFQVVNFYFIFIAVFGVFFWKHSYEFIAELGSSYMLCLQFSLSARSHTTENDVLVVSSSLYKIYSAKANECTVLPMCSLSYLNKYYFSLCITILYFSSLCSLKKFIKYFVLPFRFLIP